jgi:hypothetical protein
MAKPSWQAQAKIESGLASSVEIDMMVAQHPELVALWCEWCGWRSDLAQLEKLKPWTPRAARIEMGNIARALQVHFPNVIADQMRSAIVGNWHGLNLHHIRQQYAGGTVGTDLNNRPAW